MSGVVQQEMFMNMVEMCNLTKELYIMGVDRKGSSMSVKVPDFQPSFLIELHQGMTLLKVMDLVMRRFNSLYGREFVRYAPKPLVPLIGFCNKVPRQLTEISVLGWSAFLHVTRFLSAMDGVTVFHDMIPAANQFLLQRGLQYQSWLQITTNTLSKTSQRTMYTDCEFSAPQHSIRLSTSGDEAPPAQRLLLLRIACVSQQGATSPQHASFKPVASKPFDRIISIGIITRLGDKPSETRILTTDLGHYPELITPIMVQCDSETALIETLMTMVREYDPQAIMDYADEFDTFRYIATRYQVLTRCELLPEGKQFSLSRNLELDPRDTKYGNFTTGRTRIDLRKVFLRKGLNCESFDLECLLQVDQPDTLNSVLTYHQVNKQYARGRLGRLGLYRALAKDLHSMDSLERTYTVYAEASAFSKLTSTSVEDCVKRGQQLPVINTLRSECYGRYFINNDMQRKPVRHGVTVRPPSIQELDQPDIMRKLRTRCHVDLEKSMNHHPLSRNGKLFNANTLARGNKELQGGSVLLPCPGFYTNGDNPRAIPIGHDEPGPVPALEHQKVDNRVALLDFKALYPSIIIGFGICFSSVVIDPRMLDIPDVKYRNYCINPDETIAFAMLPDDGVLPEILKRMLSSRQQVKDSMKQYKHSDPKRYLAMDILQKCIKILCNSFYGVCGARTGVGQIAISELMYVITYIGRCLQKQALDILARLYNTACVYGDTDSVFALFEFATHLDLPRLCASSARRFQMPYLTWNWLCEHYKNSKLGWDITQAPRQLQLNALSYVIGTHVCDVINATFPTEIVLERESILTHLLLLPAKKHYCATLWDDGDPRVPQKVKITGMACKKRDYPSMVRDYLKQVTRLLVWEPNASGCSKVQQAQKIRAVIQCFIERVCERRFELKEVRTSRQYKRPEDYKNDRQPHLQVVKQFEALTGCTATPDRRIFYVFHKGNDTAYKRSVHMTSARVAQVDTLQLLTCMEKPMVSLMTFHPWVVDVKQMFARGAQTIKAKDSGIRSSLSSFFTTAETSITSTIKPHTPKQQEQQLQNTQKHKRNRPKHQNHKKKRLKTKENSKCVRAMYSKFF